MRLKMLKTSKKCRNKDLKNKRFRGGIDSDFLKFIDSLHKRFDVLESDFEYILNKIS